MVARLLRSILLVGPVFSALPGTAFSNTLDNGHGSSSSSGDHRFIAVPNSNPALSLLSSSSSLSSYYPHTNPLVRRKPQQRPRHVTARQGSGDPDKDDAKLQIRGGTFFRLKPPQQSKVVNAAAAAAVSKPAAAAAAGRGSNDNQKDFSLQTTLQNQQQPLLIILACVFATAAAALVHTSGNVGDATTAWWSMLTATAEDGGSLLIVENLWHSVTHPQATLQTAMDAMQAMGPLGALYFFAAFVALDLLSIPATPLVFSAGSLFGLPQGVAMVLGAGTVSACIAFFIGQTFLRTFVQKQFMKDNATLTKLDAAIGKDGFKVLLLLRIAPVIPFSAVNYFYGASSIDFASYFWGTLLGFAPGTLAYVYTGMVGQELLLGGGSGGGGQHWYMYGAGLAIVLALLKLVTDVATGLVAAVGEDDGTTKR